MSYNYWNDFINEWRLNPLIPSAPVIGGWTNPDILPLLNSYGSVTPDCSIEYLPEPWWGNSGDTPLHSIVINNNPFTGNGSLQAYSVPYVPNLYGNINYQEFVENEVINYSGLGVSTPYLWGTNNWHYVRRAKVLINALLSIGEIAPIAGNYHLQSHLSIELIPWHTPDSTNEQYLNYVLNNLQPIYDYVFCFAAVQARTIVNAKLNNKVLIRNTYKKITPILDALALIGKTTTRLSPLNYPIGTKGNYYRFKFDDPLINDIEFICMWGETSRNYFPQPYATVTNQIIRAL